MNKKLEDIEKYFDLPYNSFFEFINQDDLVCETEKEIADLITNYIKTRRNLVEIPKEEKKVEEENKEKIETDTDKDKEEDEENEEKEEEEKPEKSEKSEKTEENEEEENDENEEEKEKKKKAEEEENKLKERENSINNILNKWNSKIFEQKNKNNKVKLNKEEERKLIESIRISNLSHSDLISLSVEPIFADYKDLILYGLSLRLNNYESTNKLENNDIVINQNPRNYLRDQNKYLNNYTNTNSKFKFINFYIKIR